MEVDNEVSGNGNSYTTEFRQYDPRLGRWKSLDPLMAMFPRQSPYCAFDNNPVYFTDPFGDDPPENGPDNLSPKEQKEYLSLLDPDDFNVRDEFKFNRVNEDGEIIGTATYILRKKDPDGDGGYNTVWSAKSETVQIYGNVRSRSHPDAETKLIPVQFHLPTKKTNILDNGITPTGIQPMEPLPDKYFPKDDDSGGGTKPLDANARKTIDDAFDNSSLLEQDMSHSSVFYWNVSTTSDGTFVSIFQEIAKYDVEWVSITLDLPEGKFGPISSAYAVPMVFDKETKEMKEVIEGLAKSNGFDGKLHLKFRTYEGHNNGLKMSYDYD